MYQETEKFKRCGKLFFAFYHWGSVAAIFNFVIQRTLRRSISDKFLFDTCGSAVNFCSFCICYDTWQWNDTFFFC